LVAFLVALIAPFLAQQKRCQLHQFSGILIYLGAVASGAGFFGTVIKVNTGSLAIMNNALIPVGLIVNLVIWNKGQILRRF
jgi:hypothetical protein